MKAKFIVAIAAMAMLVAPVTAKRVTKQYQRPSLHMVLLKTDEPTSAQITPEVQQAVTEAWNNYEFPTLFNDINIEFKEMSAGQPKGSMMSLITKYQEPSSLSNLTADQLKEISAQLDGKAYNEDLKAKIAEVANTVAHQVIANWYNIKEDGTCNLDTITKYACFSAGQVASMSAAEEGSSAYLAMANALQDPTIANTFITFSKVDFYANEPIAKFACNIAKAIVALTGNSMAIMAGEAAAEATYKATKDGYSAYTTTLLYRLKWDDAIKENFMSICHFDARTGKGTIDYAKFQAMTFELEFMNVDKCNTIVMLGSKERKEGEVKDTDLATRCVHKNLDKQLVRLQNKNEEFKPMVPIVVVDPKYILADMGTKESVEEGEKFDVIEAVTEEVNGVPVTKYNVVATVKVEKGGVWDNQSVDNTETADSYDAEKDLQGTRLSKCKKATVSMFVKRQKTKK